MIKLFPRRLTASLNKFKTIYRSAKNNQDPTGKIQKDWNPIKFTEHKKRSRKICPIKRRKKKSTN